MRSFCVALVVTLAGSSSAFAASPQQDANKGVQLLDKARQKLASITQNRYRQDKQIADSHLSFLRQRLAVTRNYQFWGAAKNHWSVTWMDHRWRFTKIKHQVKNIMNRAANAGDWNTYNKAKLINQVVEEVRRLARKWA